MTRYVIDASAAVEYLLRTPLGSAVADVIGDTTLVAPELLDAEVLSAVRRGVLAGRLDLRRARMAIHDLSEWPIERLSHRELVRSAWEHRKNVSAYDAFYVAAAQVHDLPILTTDGRLSRASGLGVVVQHIRAG